MSKETRVGNEFAQDTVDYLSDVLGDKRIERRVLHGKNDRGDIAGIYINGKRTVIECKCCKRMELSTWIEEAEIEKANDDAEFAVVVHKRRGCGKKHFCDNYVTMRLETLAAIIAGSHELLEER